MHQLTHNDLQFIQHALRCRSIQKSAYLVGMQSDPCRVWDQHSLDLSGELAADAARCDALIERLHSVRCSP